jgi:hypothetical protein
MHEQQIKQAAIRQAIRFALDNERRFAKWLESPDAGFEPLAQGIDVTVILYDEINGQ